MIDLTQYLSSITLKTAEKRLFWAFLKPIWVLKGIKIIFFTIISLYNDFWGQTKPLTTPNRDRLDTPHIIPYVHWHYASKLRAHKDTAITTHHSIPIFSQNITQASESHCNCDFTEHLQTE